ncbi:MAG TPA: hypothetical protein O0W81_04640 [Methanocorpusculum sp.]|nr:hypothetical protein [Methanocorpusculum sp.]
MRKADDLTGRVFNNGMITVLRRIDSKSRKPRWLCLCGCGNTFTAYGFNLKSGNTKSCGCLSKTELGQARMERSSISLYRLKKDENDPYRNLANAIVAVAADDYRNALQNNDDNLVKSLESFFYFDWYRLLTNLNPNLLLELLRKENGGNLPIDHI